MVDVKQIEKKLMKTKLNKEILTDLNMIKNEWKNAGVNVKNIAVKKSKKGFNVEFWGGEFNHILEKGIIKNGGYITL